MTRQYDALFHETKHTLLDEVTEIMSEQEVAAQAIEDSALLRQLCNMKPSAGFQSLFDVAHRALHDVYLDGYFDDIFRSIVASAIEKVLGGYHERKSSRTEVRTQTYTGRKHSVRPK